METKELRAYLVQQPNLKAFCRETGLSYSTMHKFLRGHSTELKGVTKNALEFAIFQKEQKK
jgi:hypothetical protein